MPHHDASGGAGIMIEATALTKRYGTTVAVDDLSFTVRPGHVTGFLGPNGAGKSSTMRMILGLDAPTSGSVTVDRQRFADLPSPLHGCRPCWTKSGCPALLGNGYAASPWE